MNCLSTKSGINTKSRFGTLQRTHPLKSPILVMKYLQRVHINKIIRLSDLNWSSGMCRYFLSSLTIYFVGQRNRYCHPLKQSSAVTSFPSASPQHIHLVSTCSYLMMVMRQPPFLLRQDTHTDGELNESCFIHSPFPLPFTINFFVFTQNAALPYHPDCCSQIKCVQLVYWQTDKIFIFLLSMEISE